MNLETMENNDKSSINDGKTMQTGGKDAYKWEIPSKRKGD